MKLSINMKLYNKIILKLLSKVTFLLCSIVLALTIYSYALLDPNLTFINHPLWTYMRNLLVNFGYYKRDISVFIFLVIVSLLFIIHYLILNNYKKIKLINIILPVFFLSIISYPFLSRDFFNYLFDAKIVTYYQQNPYLYKALDFPADPWLRFMHWTHRTYPYGPTFLLITLIPSFLAFGKFILNFILFKLMFFIFYAIAVFLLNRMNKKWAVIFATHPLVLVEGLVNAHNDLIAVSTGIIGIYFLFKNSRYLSRIFLLVSGGIKYMTLPLVLLTQKYRKINLLVFLGIITVLIYLALKSEIQPWYFLALFVFLPFYEKLIQNLNIFFAGLLFSYYPYVRFGDWGMKGNVELKHQIIIAFLIINIIYLLFIRQPSHK